MPTENRSTELRDLFIKLNPLGLDDKDLKVDGTGFEHPSTDNEFTTFRAGYEAAQQAKLHKDEPMPAFENCIDARAYIGDLFRQCLRRHDFDQYIAERLAGDFAFALANWLVAEGNAGPAEVERLRNELGEAKGEYDRSANKVDVLRAQLAEAQALLREIHDGALSGFARYSKIEEFLSASTEPSAPVPFQARVQPWLMQCFGEMIASDREERNHRFLEEALELVQALGATAAEAHQLVDYVFGRAVGEPGQEVGGVMVTLAALCLANGLDMHRLAETELARIWTKVDAIRAKQASKPQFGPLPGVYPDRKQ